MNAYAVFALQLANERANEARERHNAHLVRAGRPSLARRALARLFTLNSRASAGIARRLDAVTAE